MPKATDGQDIVLLFPQSNGPGTKSGSSCWDAIGDPNQDNRKGKQMGVVNRMVDWVASTQSTPPATTAWRSKILRLGNSIYFQVLHINTILHLNLLLRRSITPQRLSKFRSSDYLDFSTYNIMQLATATDEPAAPQPTHYPRA